MNRLSKQEKKIKKYLAKREKRKSQKKKYLVQKKQQRAEFLSSMTDEERKEFISKEKQEKKDKETEQERVKQEGILLLIDLGYSEVMSEIEINSVVNQITQAVGFLKKSSKQYFRIVCVNTTEKMQELLKSHSKKTWQIEISTNDIDFYKEHGEIVMLSPDSKDVLQDIDKNHVYVVGGLVDRTKKNNLSLNKATEKGVKAARLPIQEENIVVKII